MKKILALLMITGMFSLVACGPSTEEQAANEVTAEEQAEEVMEASITTEAAVETTQYAEHVCTDKCTEEACFYACGEEGHVCTEACHADEEVEGEEHSEEHAH